MYNIVRGRPVTVMHVNYISLLCIYTRLNRLHRRTACLQPFETDNRTNCIRLFDGNCSRLKVSDGFHAARERCVNDRVSLPNWILRFMFSEDMGTDTTASDARDRTSSWKTTNNVIGRQRNMVVPRYGWKIYWLTVLVALVRFSAANKPPQFVTDWQTEIIVRLKEGPETPAGESRRILLI